MGEAAGCKGIQDDQVEVSEYCCHTWHVLVIEELYQYRTVLVWQCQGPEWVKAGGPI